MNYYEQIDKGECKLGELDKKAINDLKKCEFVYACNVAQNSFVIVRLKGYIIFALIQMGFYINVSMMWVIRTMRLVIYVMVNTITRERCSFTEIMMLNALHQDGHICRFVLAVA